MYEHVYIHVPISTFIQHAVYGLGVLHFLLGDASYWPSACSQGIKISTALGWFPETLHPECTHSDSHTWVENMCMATTNVNNMPFDKHQVSLTRV